MKPVISTSPDRVRTPLRVDSPRIGTIRPRSATEIGPSNWTLGCETLDRDFADWDQYRDYIAPLGLKTIRLQAGWAKCERVRGPSASIASRCNTRLPEGASLSYANNTFTLNVEVDLKRATTIVFR